jgi:N-acetylglucosamine-6-phosphate deacetylase
LNEISGEPMGSSVCRAIAASKTFDGSRLHDDCAVLFRGTRIIGIVPQAALPGGTAVRQLPDGAWLTPGFIDTQVMLGRGYRSGTRWLLTRRHRPLSPKA